MAIQTNYNGVETICKYIASTQRNYFAIFQIGKGNLPIWKQTTASSAKKAADMFREWAEVITSGDPDHSLVYELRMYENLSADADEQDDTKPANMKAGRSGLSVTFCLSTKDTQPVGQPAPSISVGYISPDLMTEKLLNQQLQFELTRQKDRCTELERGIAELESECNSGGESVSGFETFLDHPLIKALAPSLIASLSGNNNVQQAPATTRPVISGPADDKLTQAILILKKHDPQIEDDLYKLAQIAETNCGTFQYLLSTLRSMPVD